MKAKFSFIRLPSGRGKPRGQQNSEQKTKSVTHSVETLLCPHTSVDQKYIEIENFNSHNENKHCMKNFETYFYPIVFF